MNKKLLKYLFAIVLLGVFVLVRLVEQKYFDDGLIIFFHHDYLSEKIPLSHFKDAILTNSFRYWLNSLLSIVLINLFFKQKDLNKFLWLVYSIVYFVIIVLFYYLLKNYETGHYLALFYVRRFLIQPLLLFILFPALLYQQKNKAD